jgi:hypothetical protein
MSEHAFGGGLEPPAQTGALEGTDKMEKIRALLFGSQMREYDRRLVELGERLRGESERLREEQATRLGKLDAYVRGELERLSERLQQERQERLKAEEALAEPLGVAQRELIARLEGIEERLGKEGRDLRGRIERQAAEQIEAVQRSRRELGEVIEAQGERLQDQKTGRDELAALFTEVALRLNRELELPQP